MKNLIIKWLGLDVMSDAVAKIAEERELQVENIEWERLHEIFSKMEKENALVKSMVISCTHYGEKMTRFIELSKKLQKYSNYKAK